MGKTGRREVRRVATNHRSNAIRLEQPMRLKGATAVIADVHVPLTDWNLVDAALKQYKSLGLKHLLLAGDLWNLDALSEFDFKHGDAGLEREIIEGNAFVKRLLKQFDSVTLLWGNHCARLHKKLGYAVDFERSMRMLLHELTPAEHCRLKISNLDHAYVSAGKRTYYVCHPKQYSRVPLSGALKLAAKVNASVITAHSHHSAQGWDASGQHVVAELGGLFDARKTQYLQRTTAFPVWTPGYAWIDAKGQFHMVSPGGWAVDAA
jgi:hypothetical protein